MALFAYNSNVLFGVSQTLAIGDSLVVGTQGFVYGDLSLFSGEGGYHNIMIAGTVTSTGVSIFLSRDFGQTTQNTVTVTQSGILQGNIAFSCNGNSLNLVNAGLISGESIGINIFGGTSQSGSVSTIINSGTIQSGRGTAINVSGSAQFEPLHIKNSGLIVSNAFAVLLSDNSLMNDVLRNTGQIEGKVYLGGGNDLYDGRGGTASGLISGGIGDDTFRPGLGAEAFSGDLGSDTLDFRLGGAGVTIALDGAVEASGWAEGDTWTSIENLTGTQSADYLGGDAAANILEGRAGQDTILGLAGSDTLVGGGGVDRLAGGLGNDSFRFRALSECGDIVTDFSSNATGDNDRFLISRAFGTDLVAGTLAATAFQVRADNAAQDTNDRFIFRSTDTTLWFDADGIGVGAAILVADLQAGATMTNADIFLF